MKVQEIRVCLNHRGQMRYSCMESGSRGTLKAVKEAYGDTHKVKPWTCMGHCQQGPMICLLDEEGNEHFIPKGDLSELSRSLESNGD